MRLGFKYVKAGKRGFHIDQRDSLSGLLGAIVALLVSLWFSNVFFFVISTIVIVLIFLEKKRFTVNVEDGVCEYGVQLGGVFLNKKKIRVDRPTIVISWRVEEATDNYSSELCLKVLFDDVYVAVASSDDYGKINTLYKAIKSDFGDKIVFEIDESPNDGVISLENRSVRDKIENFKG